jgi:hypothetical protein
MALAAFLRTVLERLHDRFLLTNLIIVQQAHERWHIAFPLASKFCAVRLHGPSFDRHCVHQATTSARNEPGLDLSRTKRTLDPSAGRSVPESVLENT